MNVPDLKLDWEKVNGMMPAIIQDVVTKEVLMMGYMNEAALAMTLEKGLVTFFSRKQHKLWTKGETSGNTLTVRDIRTDCDRDTLLIQAIPAGPTCHTNARTCFDNGPPLYKVG